MVKDARGAVISLIRGVWTSVDGKRNDPQTTMIAVQGLIPDLQAPDRLRAEWPRFERAVQPAIRTQADWSSGFPGEPP